MEIDLVLFSKKSQKNIVNNIDDIVNFIDDYIYIKVNNYFIMQKNCAIISIELFKYDFDKFSLFFKKLGDKFDDVKFC